MSQQAVNWQGTRLLGHIPSPAPVHIGPMTEPGLFPERLGGSSAPHAVRQPMSEETADRRDFRADIRINDICFHVFVSLLQVSNDTRIKFQSSIAGSRDHYAINQECFGQYTLGSPPLDSANGTHHPQKDNLNGTLPTVFSSRSCSLQLKNSAAVNSRVLPFPCRRATEVTNWPKLVQG
jgi:hypothetical protein